MSDVMQRIESAAALVRGRIRVSPELALILGSGLGGVADRVTDAVSIPFTDIDGFPRPGVAGHAGRLVAGTLSGKSVLAMAGRGHLYEGNSVATVTFPVRVMRALGVKALLVTNAAGGIRADLGAGSFVALRDHINLMGVNPLTGPNDERLGPRFPDMTEAYDPRLRAKILAAGKKLSLPVSEGVYAALSGPSYETPAEIRMLRTIGADAVGMSTVPEVIVARHGGMKVAGISFIANAAAGISGQPLTHEEVTREADRARASFEKLVLDFVASLDSEDLA